MPMDVAGRRGHNAFGVRVTDPLYRATETSVTRIVPSNHT